MKQVNNYMDSDWTVNTDWNMVRFKEDCNVAYRVKKSRNIAAERVGCLLSAIEHLIYANGRLEVLEQRRRLLLNNTTEQRVEK